LHLSPRPVTRPSLRASVAIVALAAIALGSAGCGRSDEEVFLKDKLNPVTTQATRQKAVVSADLQNAKLGSSKDAAALNRQINVLARIEQRIAALSPPGSVRSQFERYKLANARLVAALRRFADGVGAGNTQALRTLGDGATAAVAQAQRSEDALREDLAKRH
jgi:hypothetical protein